MKKEIKMPRKQRIKKPDSTKLSVPITFYLSKPDCDRLIEHASRNGAHSFSEYMREICLREIQ